MKFVISILLFIYWSSSVRADFTVSKPINPENFIVYGNGADVNSSRIQLTLGAADTGGRVIYGVTQDISRGFVTQIEYQSFDCDNGQWQGADGFTFFMGPNIGASVASMTYGSDLAIANISSAIVIAFYISGDLNPIEPVHVVYCGANAISNFAGYDGVLNSPLCTKVYVPQLFDLRCTNRTHNFKIRYIPPNTWQIRLDGEVVSVFTGLLPSNYFTATSVQVGLSGGTGSGYMRQDVTSWSFTSSFGVIPYLECFQKFDNGTYRAHLGYNNLGETPVNLEIGSVSNKVTPQIYSSYFPSTFAPGRTLTHPLAAISFDWDGSEVSWYLTDYLVTFSGNMTERLCPSDIKLAFAFTAPEIIPDAEVGIIVHNFANFSDISPIRVICIMISYGTIVKRQADLEAELQVLVTAANETFIDEPSAEQIVSDFVTSTQQNSSIADPILNPNLDEGRSLIDAKPVNGNELPGLVPVEPSTPSSSPISVAPTSITPIKGPAGRTPVRMSGSASLVVAAEIFLVAILAM